MRQTPTSIAGELDGRGAPSNTWGDEDEPTRIAPSRSFEPALDSSPIEHQRSRTVFAEGSIEAPALRRPRAPNVPPLRAGAPPQPVYARADAHGQGYGQPYGQGHGQPYGQGHEQRQAQAHGQMRRQTQIGGPVAPVAHPGYANSPAAYAATLPPGALPGRTDRSSAAYAATLPPDSSRVAAPNLQGDDHTSILTVDELQTWMAGGTTEQAPLASTYDEELFSLPHDVARPQVARSTNRIAYYVLLGFVGLVVVLGAFAVVFPEQRAAVMERFFPTPEPPRILSAQPAPAAAPAKRSDEKLDETRLLVQAASAMTDGRRTDALKIYERLAKSDPTNTMYERLVHAIKVSEAARQ